MRKHLSFLVYKVVNFLILINFGVVVIVKGKVDKSAKLIISNHTSLLDAFTGSFAV